MSCIESFLMHFPLASRPLKLAQTSIWWSGFCIFVVLSQISEFAFSLLLAQRQQKELFLLFIAKLTSPVQRIPQGNPCLCGRGEHRVFFRAGALPPCTRQWESSCVLCGRG